MGEPRGFLNHQRTPPRKEAAAARVQHFREFVQPYTADELARQGSRCMDCGVAFCHRGCPLGNVIPEWNHLASDTEFKSAAESLLRTNNFPEFTGRVCPAPCETACVLGINSDPVAIEHIEMTLAEMAFEKGWVVPHPPRMRTGKTVAVVGSGPAGLAAAQQLNHAGHRVVVFERSAKPGGLLRYGIPDFKLEKRIVERRISLLEQEGIEFLCNRSLGEHLSLEQLQQEFDAVLLACGAGQARELKIPGNALAGVHLAMTYLSQSNRIQSGETASANEGISAAGKDVIVIGGGDTGSDCVGTALRQGARSVTQFEILPRPPDLGAHAQKHERPSHTPWPEWPAILRTSTSHEEGGERHWSLESLGFEGNAHGHVTSLSTRQVEWSQDASGKTNFSALPDTEHTWPCQLVLVACGFTGAEASATLRDAGVQFDERGNIRASASDYRTDAEKIFAAGDMRRGQSLVVWAIAEGRKAAQAIDAFLS